ncbi:uncharacterized protein LOC111634412 [Centruroides sculpturatus]|uniref:uncharacterized protein LOC111634412 n=1 Tax=Centruroides sculpturatus TaxID=218467 RepID=UPI000C6D42A1|nr:uncharacterized protein LOC111634412 [Centruroides sculpturatus]
MRRRKTKILIMNLYLHWNLYLHIGSLFILLASCTIISIDDRKKQSKNEGISSVYAKNLSGTNKLLLLNLKHNNLNIIKNYFILNKIYWPFQKFNSSNKRQRRAIHFKDFRNGHRPIRNNKRKWPKHQVRHRKNNLKQAKKNNKFKIRKMRKFYTIENFKKKRLANEKISRNDGIMYFNTFEPSYKEELFVITTGLLGGISLILLISFIIFTIKKKLGSNSLRIENKLTAADYGITTTTSESDFDESVIKATRKLQYTELPLESNLPVRFDTGIQCVPDINKSENITPENEETRELIRRNSIEAITPQLMEEEQELKSNKQDIVNDEYPQKELISTPKISLDKTIKNNEIYYYSDETFDSDPLTDIKSKILIFSSSSSSLEILESHNEEDDKSEIGDQFNEDIKYRKREQNKEKGCIFEVRTRRINSKQSSKSKDEDSETNTSLRTDSLSSLIPMSSSTTPRTSYTSENDSKLKDRLKTVSKDTKINKSFILDRVKKENFYFNENETIRETERRNRHTQIIPEESVSSESDEWPRLQSRRSKEHFKLLLPNLSNKTPQLLSHWKVQEWLQRQ